MASVWGSCQRKRIPNSTHAPSARSSRAATQPVTGGKAPGTAPMIVQSAVRIFSGV